MDEAFVTSVTTVKKKRKQETGKEEEVSIFGTVFLLEGDQVVEVVLGV